MPLVHTCILAIHDPFIHMYVYNPTILTGNASETSESEKYVRGLKAYCRF